MAFVLNPDCPCCAEGMRRGMGMMVWHCEDCWNKWHNGLRDKDFIAEEPEEHKKSNERIAQKMRELRQDGGEM
jgi:ribosomal protein L37AE/L43A